MEQLSKIVFRQDTNFKLTPSSSNETSINLSNEISDFISNESGEVSFTIYKVDLIKALGALANFPALYSRKDSTPIKTIDLFNDLSSQINAEFSDADTAVYTINLLKREDGRSYFNGLKALNGFNIRSFLVEKYSEMIFERMDDGTMTIRLHTSCEELTPSEELLEKIKEMPNSPELLMGESLQRIYYGAPGTGKSYTINEMCAKWENYRTTFHPDTDYAAFVGSYKPITKKVPVYASYGNTAMPMKDKDGNDIMEDRIVYRYVFQAFLKSYIAAWKEQQNPEPKPVFLIIEEINRGNCAQIFGDIFQLLDRNEAGFSDYPIVADDDLAQELKRVLGDFNIVNAEKINALYESGKDVVTQVKSGSHLLLPNNLYIWATMNTSDQSLFPIDSAFKRRWDWKYIKIKDAEKGYRIIFSNGNQYDWWQFVSAINAEIEGGEIQQEDKKLGYFFAKACNGKICAETFVSKVLFYLYNDVFKDFGLEEAFFKDENGETMTFASYFDHLGQVEEDRMECFLKNLGLSPISSNEDETDIQDSEFDDFDDEDPNDKKNGRDFTQYTINGEGKYKKKHIASAIIEKYVEQHPDMTAVEVVSKWKGLGNIVSHFVETQAEYDSRTDKPESRRVDKIECKDEIIYVSNNGWGTKSKMEELQNALNEHTELGFSISEVKE